MLIENAFTVARPVDEVWDYLLDVQRIAPCMPGAELTETVDERTWKGKVNMKFGPVSMSFAGQVQIAERDDAAHRVVLHARGTEQKGKFVIRLCRTISCQMKGRDMVARQLENDLGITFGETTEDGMFTLEWTSCLGMCDKGPALMVNEKIYSAVTPAGVHAILDECRNKYTVHALAKEGR